MEAHTTLAIAFLPTYMYVRVCEWVYLCYHTTTTTTPGSCSVLEPRYYLLCAFPLYIQQFRATPVWTIWKLMQFLTEDRLVKRQRCRFHGTALTKNGWKLSFYVYQQYTVLFSNRVAFLFLLTKVEEQASAQQKQ